jgi:four helix bundle protein
MPKLENRNSKIEVTTTASTPARIRDFTDLEVWQLARDLRRYAFKETAKFPADERFGLSQQLRRAANSVTANIAEGFGRYSYQENIQFCRFARGSIYELRDHLITAADQGYLPPEDRSRLDALAQRVIQVLNGYIRSTQARQRQNRTVQED